MLRWVVLRIDIGEQWEQISSSLLNGYVTETQRQLQKIRESHTLEEIAREIVDNELLTQNYHRERFLVVLHLQECNIETSDLL